MDQVSAFVRSEMILKADRPVERRFTVYFQYKAKPAELIIYNQKGVIRDFQYLEKFLNRNAIGLFQSLSDPDFQCNICESDGTVSHQIQQWEVQLVIQDITSDRIIWVKHVLPHYVAYSVYIRI